MEKIRNKKFVSDDQFLNNHFVRSWLSIWRKTICKLFFEYFNLILLSVVLWFVLTHLIARHVVVVGSRFLIRRFSSWSFTCKCLDADRRVSILRYLQTFWNGLKCRTHRTRHRLFVLNPDLFIDQFTLFAAIGKK